MAKNRQHFVPRFYLSAFSSAPKRINVFVADRTLAIRDASLRKQCYGHKFYGQTFDEEVENALAEMEGHAAPFCDLWWQLDESGSASVRA